jgi:hypothetical protein
MQASWGEIVCDGMTICFPPKNFQNEQNPILATSLGDIENADAELSCEDIDRRR